MFFLPFSLLLETCVLRVYEIARGRIRKRVQFAGTNDRDDLTDTMEPRNASRREGCGASAGCDSRFNELREGRSMKGDVNKNSSAMTGDRDDIQPRLRRRAAVFVLQIHGASESTADFPVAASRAVAGANHGSI